MMKRRLVVAGVIGGYVVLAAIIATLYRRNNSVAAEIARTRKDAVAAKHQLVTREHEDAVMKAKIDQLNTVPRETESDIKAEGVLGPWLDQMFHLRDFAKEYPRYSIPEFSYLKMSDWLAVTQDKTFSTEADYREALAELRLRAKIRAGRDLLDAIDLYKKANYGMIPEGIELLAPYLPQSFNDAILAQYTIQPRLNTSNNSGPNGTFVLTEKAPPDAIWNGKVFMSDRRFGTQAVEDKDGKMIERAIEAYKSQFNVEPTDYSQIASYVKKQVAPKRAEAIFSACVTKPNFQEGR